MVTQRRTVLLRDGTPALLRSPEVKDAQALLDFLKATAGESDNLLRAPGEITMTLQQEEAFLDALLVDERRVMVNAYIGDGLAGNVTLFPVGGRSRMRHRCEIGIAVRRAYWGRGLGALLMREVLSLAPGLRFSQAELGVYADNTRAVKLYEGLGFETWGRVKNACLMPDGRLRDELLMGLVF